MTSRLLVHAIVVVAAACASTARERAPAALELPLVEIAAPRIEAEARLCGRRSHSLGVIDGDTLDVVLTRIVDPGVHGEAACKACRAGQTRDRHVHGDTQVRLGGGIDAPEADAPGGRETREALLALLAGADRLYLDIDDRARGCERHGHPGRDKYCRLLAKVYVRSGDAFVDVHATLLAWGRAHFPDHDWLRYADRPSEFGPPVPAGGAPAEADDPIVYVTRSGERYHRAGCASLSQSAIPLRRSEAERRGYAPCRACAGGGR